MFIFTGCANDMNDFSNSLDLENSEQSITDNNTNPYKENQDIINDTSIEEPTKEQLNAVKELFKEYVDNGLIVSADEIIPENNEIDDAQEISTNRKSRYIDKRLDKKDETAESSNIPQNIAFVNEKAYKQFRQSLIDLGLKEKRKEDIMEVNIDTGTRASKTFYYRLSVNYFPGVIYNWFAENWATWAPGAIKTDEEENRQFFLNLELINLGIERIEFVDENESEIINTFADGTEIVKENLNYEMESE